MLSSGKCTLMYLCYGQGFHRDEIIYSILSAFRFVPAINPLMEYVVYTDDPASFEHLGITVRVLSAIELDEWLNGATYIHRRKTVAIIDALRRFPGNVAFVDSDTYFLRSPLDIFDRIGPGRTVLHVREAKLHQLKKWESDLVRYLGSAHLRDGTGALIRLSEQDAMWNSGVIGINTADIELLEQALPVIDEIWRNCKANPIEQFVTGHFLSRVDLSACRPIVFHYWAHELRNSFRNRLVDLVKPLVGESILEQAERIYASRPIMATKGKAKEIFRESLRFVGIPTSGALKSY